MNNDGALNLNDAVLALQTLAGVNPALPAGATGAAVGAESKIGLADVLFLMQTMAGLR